MSEWLKIIDWLCRAKECINTLQAAASEVANWEAVPSSNVAQQKYEMERVEGW